MCWDPEQYERFKAERRQPFDDLLALVTPFAGGRVIDLGCGTGELTAELHTILQASETVGIDSSPEMLAGAKAREHDGLHFIGAEIGNVAAGWDGSAELENRMLGGRFDVVFSNAALQWVPDHSSLLKQLVLGVVPGGQLAVQVPANFDHPSHTAAYEVAAEDPFATVLVREGAEPQRAGVLSPESYAAVLDSAGAVDIHVRLQVYLHRLASTRDVVEWTKGTLLTPYRDALGDEMFAEFVERYTARLVEVLGDVSPYLFTFKRILMWARF